MSSVQPLFSVPLMRATSISGTQSKNRVPQEPWEGSKGDFLWEDSLQRADAYSDEEGPEKSRDDLLQKQFLGETCRQPHTPDSTLL